MPARLIPGLDGSFIAHKDYDRANFVRNERHREYCDWILQQVAHFDGDYPAKQYLMAGQERHVQESLKRLAIPTAPEEGQTYDDFARKLDQLQRHQLSNLYAAFSLAQPCPHETDCSIFILDPTAEEVQAICQSPDARMLDHHTFKLAAQARQCKPWLSSVRGLHFCCGGSMMARDKLLAVIGDLAKNTSAVVLHRNERILDYQPVRNEEGTPDARNLSKLRRQMIYTEALFAVWSNFHFWDAGGRDGV